MLCQPARLCKLCKLVKRIFQQILGRYSRLGIDNQSRALSVHSLCTFCALFVHSLCTFCALSVLFLCTLRMINSISLIMRSLGRQYVRYFNGCYGRSGTLWEGCYKSCLVQAEITFCISIDI